MHEDSVLLGYDTVSVDNQIPKSLLLQHYNPWIRRNYVAFKQGDPITCWLNIIPQKDGILSFTTAKTSTHICTGPILDTFQTWCFGNWIRISGIDRINELLRTSFIILWLKLSLANSYNCTPIVTNNNWFLLQHVLVMFGQIPLKHIRVRTGKCALQWQMIEL